MSHCTPKPEGLRIVGHIITCESDWRVWEAPPGGFDGELVYVEATGRVLAGEHECSRIHAPDEPGLVFETVPDEPEVDRGLQAILDHNEAAGFEAINVEEYKQRMTPTWNLKP